jgi:hypothetical protein
MFLMLMIVYTLTADEKDWIDFLKKKFFTG